MGMYDVGCAVTADLNRYMRQQDEAEARDRIIEERADELVRDGEDCEPFTLFNISEAMSEFDGTGLEALAKLLKSGNTAGAGLALSELVKDYWNRMAKKQAEREIENATCRHCYDQGCYRCDPPEPDRDY